MVPLLVSLLVLAGCASDGAATPDQPGAWDDADVVAELTDPEEVDGRWVTDGWVLLAVVDALPVGLGRTNDVPHVMRPAA